jgi:hypothetical protein
MPAIRILLDNNVSRRLIPLLRPHEAVHASQLGWADLANGDLIRAADENGFHLLITGDRNIRYQQNLTRVGCSIIELSTQHWPTVRINIDQLLAAVSTAISGGYITVALPRPPLLRRPPPSNLDQ